MENKITAILVDDESNSRVVLRSLLERFSTEIELLGEAANVEDAYKLIIAKKPQLVFLDIQMPRANGFALLQKFEEVPFEVIFVTSYDKYAINAIKFSALDYLLKPVEVVDLKEAIKKAVNSIAHKNNNRTLVINLLRNLESKPQQHKIAVHVAESVKLLDENRIAYIEADGSYCQITLSTNERYTTAKYLKDFEDYFGEESSFVRIHKSCLINTKYIKAYSKGEPCIIEMTDGKNFEVARRKKQEVLEKLKI
jgi:two-component system LytT family response regulator